MPAAVGGVASGVELCVGEFVALLNQTLDYAYPDLVVIGELANLRVSKNRWVYFDLKDEQASVKFFGTVYQLPGPLEDGMLLRVRGQPRLHNLYGFSVNVQAMWPAGEGSIRKAADLLQAKLTAEGLFDEARKRPLPYPPATIGLITSGQSAAYADFTKILQDRWSGINILHIDVQVQGEIAPSQISAAIEQFNAEAKPPEVLVIIRGGGSAEDLAAFSNERVTRAVAASRVPTLVAIGHEIDLSLAELAADQRASTPSNAAELLVPDRQQVRQSLQRDVRQLQQAAERHLRTGQLRNRENRQLLAQLIAARLAESQSIVDARRQLLLVLSPQSILRRGYAVVRRDGAVVRSSQALQPGNSVQVQLAEGVFTAAVTTTANKEEMNGA